MDMDSLRAIIGALRGSPSSGISRDAGHVPRRISGDPVKSMQKDVQYGQYQKVQHSIGESPVSYEEWMRSQ